MTKRPSYSKAFKDSIIALYQDGRSSKSLDFDNHAKELKEKASKEKQTAN